MFFWLSEIRSEPIGQDLSRVPQRQPHLLVANRRQSQRLRPQLHAAHSHRIGGLQSVTSLDPP